MVVFFWIVGIVWAISGTFVVLASLASFHFGWALVQAAGSYWLLAILVWRMRRAKAADAKMLAGAPAEPGKGYRHAENGTGIAVDTEAKTVAMQAGGIKKTYPYSSVRSWEVVKQTAGEIVGGGLPAVGAQLRANKKARLASGLFVTVKDIDCPKWRIEMSDTRMQDRWMEILRQEINEDKAA